ncbi:hypothetical protein ACFQMA_12230 [Halosimplex aquaticum]|uniref:RecA-superfamily ATPase, KaiC/GvpD/RAD55 family n=1 Tax=Halosimplex aquaticum TaxID=3026162 RepID=A0ABD5Y5F3_9EURY|nr:hypothetical protein [Halosimplex aquaticum]
MNSITEQVGASIHSGDNLLVMCPSFMGDESRVCLELLTPAPPAEVYALSVLFTQSPGDHLDAWQRSVGSLPARSRIVSVDADARSSTTERDADDPTVERVTSPQNLTRLGVRITDCLDEWGETAPDRQVSVCFQSVSTLLQYVELEQVFKFLDVLTERCRASGAISHYHLDPQAHDDQTIERLVGLFDGVFEYADDEWSYRQPGDG